MPTPFSCSIIIENTSSLISSHAYSPLFRLSSSASLSSPCDGRGFDIRPLRSLISVQCSNNYENLFFFYSFCIFMSPHCILFLFCIVFLTWFHAVGRKRRPVVQSSRHELLSERASSWLSVQWKGRQ
jgi:hypothetical protein